MLLKLSVHVRFTSSKYTENYTENKIIWMWDNIIYKMLPKKPPQTPPSSGNHYLLAEINHFFFLFRISF